MSMKVLPSSKKHQCPRQRCQGDMKNYRNYLVPPSHSKKKLKRPQTTRSQHSINEHLPKQSKIHNKSKPSKPSLIQKTEMSEMIRRNEENVLKNSELAEQLQLKSRRITELKQKVKDYELKLRGSEERIAHLQTIINESEHPKSPITSSHSQQYVLASYQHQMRTFESNQKLMLDQIQKCRMVQRQYQQYRGETQRKIERLTLQNQQLRQLQSTDKDYDGQIDQLRKQLLKLSQQKQSHDLTNCTSQNEINTLKASNRHLMAQREHLLLKIEEQVVKEGDLRRNLETINHRVEKWGRTYEEVIEEKKRLEERCQYLERKLQEKKDKHQKQKEEWARIFKELTHMVEKSKRDIQRLQKSNHKLINIYSEPNNE